MRQSKSPTLFGEFGPGKKKFSISPVIYFILAYLILLGITCKFIRYHSSEVTFYALESKSFFCFLKQTIAYYT